MTSLLDQHNKLVPCPTTHEESWKRTNPDIFFLPDDEVLNFQGQNAMEYKNKLTPWKVSFCDFKNISSVLNPLEKTIGKEGLDALNQELNRLVVVDISHGQTQVYMNDNLKSNVEFMSTPWQGKPISKNSAIATALVSRLKASSPHKLQVTLSTKNHEVPLVVILNNCNPQFSQSYCVFHLIIKQNSKSDVIFIEGGAPFSLFRHHLELEENAKCNEFWLNTTQNSIKSSYMERIVSLDQNAHFNDAQFFISQGNIKIQSRIVLKGQKAISQTGGVILANEGKLDMEPVQEHRASFSKSDLSLKIILNKKARISFQGLIQAQKEALKCEAKQENKNILLSKLARIDSEPRLEILPDDIVCKHGSATGEIDKNQLYYLQSRGFNQEEARQLILKSFAQSAYPILEEGSSLQKILESTLSSHIHKVL